MILALNLRRRRSLIVCLWAVCNLVDVNTSYLYLGIKLNCVDLIVNDSVDRDWKVLYFVMNQRLTALLHFFVIYWLMSRVDILQLLCVWGHTRLLEVLIDSPCTAAHAASRRVDACGWFIFFLQGAHVGFYAYAWLVDTDEALLNQVLQLWTNLFVRLVLVNHNVRSLTKLCFTASRVVFVSSLYAIKDPLVELFLILGLFIRGGLATLSRAIHCDRGYFWMSLDARWWWCRHGLWIT